MEFLRRQYWTLVDWVALSLVSFFCLFIFLIAPIVLANTPYVVVKSMRAYVENGVIMISPDVRFVGDVNGGYGVVVRYARPGGDVVCPQTEQAHQYVDGETYEDDKTLGWWTNGDCPTTLLSSLAGGEEVVIETRYLVPRFGPFLYQWTGPYSTNQITVPILEEN